jgi:peptidoglycan/LPS O-acetylase OafA/YrhL
MPIPVWLFTAVCIAGYVITHVLARKMKSLFQQEVTALIGNTVIIAGSFLAIVDGVYLFGPLSALMLACVGSVVIVAAEKAYKKWSNGRSNTVLFSE